MQEKRLNPTPAKDDEDGLLEIEEEILGFKVSRKFTQQQHITSQHMANNKSIIFYNSISHLHLTLCLLLHLDSRVAVKY